MPHELFFVGGHSLRRDSNGDYYLAPQWEQTGAGQGIAAYRHPYLYRVGEPITLDPIVFKKHPNSEELTEPIDIKGTGSDGAKFGPASMSVYNELAYPVSSLQADKVFATTTEYDPEYSINWEFSTDGKPYGDSSKEWKSAGTTSHILYACLADATPYSASLYRSVVHLACSNKGESSPANAVAKSWALLSGPNNFTGWDDSSESWTRDLYYYKSGTVPTSAGWVGNLLNSGNSQCSCWASLFLEAIRINGASNAQYIVVTPDFGIAEKRVYLLVDEWSVIQTTFPGTNFPWAMVFPAYLGNDPIAI